MSKLPKYTTEEKYKILEAYEHGYETMQETLIKYSTICFLQLQIWNKLIKAINLLEKTFKELKKLAKKDQISGIFSKNNDVKKMLIYK